MIIIYILAIFSIAFFIKEMDGPFGIMNWIRNKLISSRHCGVFFYKLLNCFYCSGCWSALIVYLIHINYHQWKLNDSAIWFFSGGATCLIISAILNKLSEENK